MDAVMDPFIVVVAVIWGLWWCVKNAARLKGPEEAEPWWNLAGFGLAEAFGYPAAEPVPPARPVPDADDASFIDGACEAYEKILLAMAAGDLAPVAGLMTAEVRADLDGVLASRRRLGEVASLTLVGISAAKVLGSGTLEQMKWAEVRVRADLVTCIRDRDGEVILGDPNRVAQTSDIWTFERNMQETGSPWRLAATPDDGDGHRVLVDRLWPRGLRKAEAAVELWLKDAAPSPDLRKWFGHEPARFEEFSRRYRAELAHAAPALDELRRLATTGPVTLLYAAHDETVNHARVLKFYLDEHPSS
jgi:uncharacterized protein YeaO (DUF488 family)